MNLIKCLLLIVICFNFVLPTYQHTLYTRVFMSYQTFLLTTIVIVFFKLFDFPICRCLAFLMNVIQKGIVRTKYTILLHNIYVPNTAFYERIREPQIVVKGNMTWPNKDNESMDRKLDHRYPIYVKLYIYFSVIIIIRFCCITR